MMSPPLEILVGHPLFGLALTIGVYLGAMRLHRASGGNPLLTPVLISVVVVGGVIWAAEVEYADYLAQAAPLHYALGVLVVLLAVPLVRRWSLIRRAGAGLFIALLIGSAAAIALAIWFPLGLDGNPALTASLAPKSATAPVAIGISERIGGIAGLTAMVAVLTGIFGAVAGPGLLAAARISDERAAGFALGLASHAIGTARAFQISETAGAFASVGMILNALLTVLLAPILIGFVTG